MPDPDLRHLGPAEFVRMMNSTRFGTVVTARKVGLHREAAGFRIGDAKTVDLLRYAAWLVAERHKPKPPAPTTSDYDRRKERARKASEAASLSGRDIAPIPAVVDQARREACGRDFRRFCETYFRQTFTLEWSDDHLTVIGQIETSVLDGGLFATAMPRGSGKTSLAEVAAIWAILYGHRNFIPLLGSDETHALQMLDSIKTEFESNEMLLEDFPEAVYPIVCLEGIAHRCAGQLCNGERTHIGWTNDEVIMPTVPGSKASGAIIKVSGITGGVRGMKHKRQDGKTVRPDLVIIDDPQTDQSSRSPSQCATRERLIAGAILGLAGPGRKISGIMPCTVISRGDVADNILDRSKHPIWNGTKTKMVYAFPVAEKLWQEYRRIRDDSLASGRGGREATAFYAANRAAMDAGAVVAWPARHDPDEISAVQNAMNLLYRDEDAFWSEYQNEPRAAPDVREDDLSPDEICGKLNRMPRGDVPTPVEHLTCFIDVSGTLLWWMVCGWEEDFTGYVLDYGAYPDQRTAYYTLRDAKVTLADVVKATGLEGQIYGGLEAIGRAVLDREWRRDDGAALKVSRCLIDANWIDSTATVLRFCRQSAHSAILLPSRGKYVGAAGTPMSEWAKRPGERTGLNWKVALAADRKDGRRVIFDSNFWKSFVHTRLATAMGDRGALTLFGERPEEHRMLADQLCSEYRVRTVGRGRECDEWKQRPNKPDNHFLDCLAGCAVAASMQGVAIHDGAPAPARAQRRERIRMSDLQRRKRA